MSDACTVTCGGGTLTMTRECTNPSPSCGGANCTGIPKYEKQCNTRCCPGTGNIVLYLSFHTMLNTVQLMVAGAIGR